MISLLGHLDVATFKKVVPSYCAMFHRIITYFTLLLIWCCLQIKGNSGTCREGVSKEVTSYQLLRGDVFCSYDKNVRPVIKHTSNTTVTIKMFIKFFTLSWKDEYLKWTSSDYGNITTLHVNSKDIWVPDFSIYNSGDMDSTVGFQRTLCVVYSEGNVLCVPVAKWPVHCTANLRQWPFDSHECTMRIGSWAHTGEMIDIKLQDGGVGMEDFGESREWELQNVTAVKNVAIYDCCPNSTYPTVLYKFIIKRHATAYSATVIIPSLVVAGMTLLTFWLDPILPHRLGLCTISILCHCLYLQYLGVKLPSNGTMTPVIVLFFRDSLVICGAALILSVILLRLSSSSIYSSNERESTPFWLSRILGIVLDQKIGKILCLGQFNSKNSPVKGDGATLIENGTEVNDPNGKISNDWLILVSVIDRLAFLIFSFTYIVLLIVLIPVNLK